MEPVITNGIEQRHRFGWLFFLALVPLLGQIASGGLILQSNRFGDRQTISMDGAIGVPVDGFTGRFFGQSVSNLWLAENGYLSPVANLDTRGDFFSQSLTANTLPRIAGFWDDIRVVSEADGGIPGSGIYLARERGSFLAVTWSNIFLEIDTFGGLGTSSTLARSFQTVWFESDTTIEQFEFKRDDIVFGFSGFREGYIDATVGMRDLQQFISIDEATGRPLGRAPGGMISTTKSSGDFPNAHLLPWANGQFLLFRANDSNAGSFVKYSASIGSLDSSSVAAVPEPSCIVMVAAGFGLFFFARGAKYWRTNAESLSSLIRPTSSI